MLELIVRDREVKGKKEEKKKTHFISGFLRSTRCPRSTLFTTYSIPLTFTSPGEFCSFTLRKRMATILLLFLLFSCLCVLRVCVCGGVCCLCVVSQTTHKHTTLPWKKDREKKNTCFYGFQSSLIQRSCCFFFFPPYALSPNLSRSKPIVKTLWPRQTL